jgi:1-acyl-sn-glycerol-3-phosphate acyltransferase
VGTNSRQLLRLFSLLAYQAARALSDQFTRVLILLELGGLHRVGGRILRGRDVESLLAAVLGLAALVLAPVAGALANSLPKRRVLMGTSALCAVALLALGMGLQSWLVCWALVAVALAVDAPTRFALLPAAAQDEREPLPRLNAWMVVLWALAFLLFTPPTRAFPTLSEVVVDHQESWVVLALVALNLVALRFAGRLDFSSDTRRPGPLTQALWNSFGDAHRIVRDREACFCLLLGSVARAAVPFLPQQLLFGLGPVAWAQESPTAALGNAQVGLWSGLVIGALLGGIQGHPRRSLGLIPLVLAGLLLWLAIGQAGGVPLMAFCGTVGALLGVLLVALQAGYQERLPGDARGSGMALSFALDALFWVLLYSFLTGAVAALAWPLWLAAVGLVLCAGCFFFREMLEQLFEPPVCLMYRIRARGPGKDIVPHHGPLLVVANHSTYADPFLLAKVLPRRLIPMMTSVFYDLPVIRWLMRLVVHTIRVQVGKFRREAPELKEAVAALDRGECVVIFPEGSLRRKEQPMLRMFGQGVWHILNERPKTPVVVCWVEGGWGSFLSYFNGKPGKNKRVDFRRPIDVVIDAPAPLKPAVLKEHRATRTHLMERSLKLRGELGLPATQEAPVEAEEGA